MNELKETFALDLEVTEIERAARPGCNSSSTHPRCTCPIPREEDAS
jgi:hypothetical protein